MPTPTVSDSRIITAITTGTSTMYSRRRNAMAPVSIRPEISRIRGVPTGWRLMAKYIASAASRPSRPNSGAKRAYCSRCTTELLSD